MLTWCISMVTVPPAVTAQVVLAGLVPELQAKSLPVTSVTGELLPGKRTQSPPC